MRSVDMPSFEDTDIGPSSNHPVADWCSEIHSWRGARHPTAGGEQSADVLALSNLQPSGRFQSNWSHRNRRCPLVALRPLSARLSFIGSIGAIITFVVTVSFLISTPGAFQFSHGFPLLGDAGQFLIKHLVFLGASIWTAAEARKVG